MLPICVHGGPWLSIVVNGRPWWIIVTNGVRLSMVAHGFPFVLHVFLSSIMAGHCILWRPKVVHYYHWWRMVVHGRPLQHMAVHVAHMRPWWPMVVHATVEGNNIA